MPAPKGHPLYGNPLHYKKITPKELWDGAINYFDWCRNNPWIKTDFKGKDAEKVEIPIDRPFTIEGLCIYLNINRLTFNNYSNAIGYETYFDICSHIRDIINTQQFEGGMVGVFNANIVTRKLGLVEKTENKTDMQLVWNEELTYETKPKANNGA